MKFAGAILVLFALVSCGDTVNDSLGGAEAGNPTTRVVKGLVVDGGAAQLAKFQSVGDCVVDAALATDAAARTASASLQDDCSFSLDLAFGRSYSISFLRGGSFVASLVFNNRPGAIASPAMIVSRGDDDIDLGNVTISGATATAANEPSLQNDQDDDGLSDFDDDDDDGDGRGDDDETDCDLDGHLNDYDEDEDCGSDDENEDEEDGDDDGDGESASILEVNPRNGQTNVSPEEDIEVRAGCAVDASTLTDASFAVSSPGVSWACDFETSSSGEVMKCEHDEFPENTTVTVAIDGLSCESGAPLPGVSWSFTTEN